MSEIEPVSLIDKAANLAWVSFGTSAALSLAAQLTDLQHPVWIAIRLVVGVVFWVSLIGWAVLWIKRRKRRGADS